MADFDNRVNAGRAGAVVMDDIDESCSNILHVLHLYGKEMVVAQGDSYMADSQPTFGGTPCQDRKSQGQRVIIETENPP